MLSGAIYVDHSLRQIYLHKLKDTRNDVFILYEMHGN